jgi:hypothetical protein
MMANQLTHVHEECEHLQQKIRNNSCEYTLMLYLSERSGILRDIRSTDKALKRISL